MNALEKWLAEHFAGELGQETETMNELQEHGIISDNCVRAADVADADARRAAEWLERQE
jgi:hypothetical protein